jgi:hypothetical protein
MVREIIQIHNNPRVKQYLAISDKIVISFYSLLHTPFGTTTFFFQLPLFFVVFATHPLFQVFLAHICFCICESTPSTKNQFSLRHELQIVMRGKRRKKCKKNQVIQVLNAHLILGNFNN